LQAFERASLNIPFGQHAVVVGVAVDIVVVVVVEAELVVDGPV
jgi:hypothetical protein